MVDNHNCSRGDYEDSLMREAATAPNGKGHQPRNGLAAFTCSGAKNCALYRINARWPTPEETCI